MPRHTKTVDRRARTLRRSTVVVVWLGGLAAGFFGLLSAAARYGCGASDTGLACRPTGTAAGIVVVLAVIAVVTAVTVMSHDQAPRRLMAIAVAGLVALLLCFVAARRLLSTV